jgi:c-di-GMP-binding flagellar brake protein YcgR
MFLEGGRLIAEWQIWKKACRLAGGRFQSEKEGKMFFRKKMQDERAGHGWAFAQGGFETTRSRRLIGNVISSLEKKRRALILVQKRSRSNPTILLGSTDKYLLIDAPKDWKLRSLTVRIRFKDEADLDFSFDSKIVYIKDEIIYVKMPNHLVRFQRRAHYRVEVPGGSQVVFGRQAGGERFSVRNISAGGMLCCGQNRQLARGTDLKEIDLLLPLAAGRQARKTIRINIPQGHIVRRVDDRDTGHSFFGVAFECGVREESNLTAYIRQREIELAKAETPA